MQETKEKLVAKFDLFRKEAAAAIRGNKAAGVRSRKLSLQLGDMLKEWRAVSVEQLKGE